MEKRNRYTAEFKAKVVLELLREESTLNQVAAKYQLNPQMLSQWKSDFVKNASVVFERNKDEAGKLKKEMEEKESRYQQIIGQQSYEIDWLKKNLASSSTTDIRKTMADPGNHRISLTRQAYLLTVNRSSLYRQPPTNQWSQTALDDMRLIDEIYTKCSFYGYRRITAEMQAKGRQINRKRVRRLMGIMGIQGICPGPNLSKRLHAKYVYPYLLRNLKVDHPDQVWAVDITYIRMRQGFMYLFVIIDLYSRYIVDYELSTSMDRYWVLECLKRAFQHRKPEIINSDQGSQFTNQDYIELLQNEGIKISMDGKGRALDNIFVERFFRTLKYENIYLNEYETPKSLRKGLNQYIRFYNEQRLHGSLEYRCPIDFYHQNLAQLAS
ncbi:IS3 family transposase [Syntrophomonas palmitatica]|uniref:IS3 family transposase n=1 Tax=Syntrophomonas palmitatica TaxID=402877 RepID=UPI0012ED5889